MKALVCDCYGSFDCVRYRDVPDPVAKPDEILVSIRAAGAVFTDLLFVQGRYQVKPDLPFVLGSEMAGEVIAVGERVTRFRPGDRIMSLALRFGAFAERIALPEWLPVRMPASLPYETGAALISSSATAQHALRQKAQLQPGETLVVTGAAGGTGSAAIQVGKAIGARVIAVVSSAERAQFCKSLGADDTIDYNREDLKQAIKDRTEGRGADVILETVGGNAFDACSRAMAVDGRLLVVGFASGRIPSLPVNLTLVKVYSVIGVHWLTFVKKNPELHAANMEELVTWVEQGLVSPPVSAVFPLSEGVSALKKIESRDVLGKVVLKV